MRFYHFCPNHQLGRLLRGGLAEGELALGGGNVLRPAQWLSTSGAFDQPWPGHRSPLIEADYRLTIDIPDSREASCHLWDDLRQLPLLEQASRELAPLGDSRHWVLYLGTVRPEWISEWKAAKTLKSLHG